MALIRLPAEILLLVLQSLQSTELVHCRAVCRRLRDVIDSKPHFRLVIELGAAGYIDNPRSNVTTRSKMELLNEHVRAFSCLHWGLRRMMDPFDRCIKHRLANGSWFRLCDTTQQDALEAFPVDLDVDRRESFLVYDALPSLRQPGFVGPQVFRFPAIIDELVVDASQELVVGMKMHLVGEQSVTCQMFFQSINSSSDENLTEDHPKAFNISRKFKWRSSSRHYHTTAHLMGPFIGVLFSRDSERLLPGSSDIFILYNWISGAKIVKMESCRSDEYWETFCFISDGTVLIPSTFTGTLNIFTFSEQPSSLKHAITFLLPETRHQPGLRHIDLATHPSSSRCNADDEPPFISNPEDAVIVFFLDYFYPSTSGSYTTNLNFSQTFAVPVRVFMSAVNIIEKMQERAKRAIRTVRPVDPSQCDWSCPVTDPTIGYHPCVHKMYYERMSWMPLRKRTPHIHSQNWIKHTRWGLESMPESTGQCVHGTRYLAMASHNELVDEDASALILYDFNMKNVRRGAQLSEPNEHPHDMSEEDENEWIDQWGQYFKEGDKRHWAVSEQKIVTSTSIVNVPEIFTSSFTCTLPYRVVQCEHVFRWDTAMIDGERIVGLEYSRDELGSVEVLDVLVF